MTRLSSWFRMRPTIAVELKAVSDTASDRASDLRNVSGLLESLRQRRSCVQDASEMCGMTGNSWIRECDLALEFMS